MVHNKGYKTNIGLNT